MNGGLRKRNNLGFTIVEVLIVLAVSGFMLVSAIVIINGKQKVTAFNQGVRSAETQVRQIVNEVGSGYYQNDGSITCGKNGPGGGPKLTIGAKELGANAECIFLGKVIQFAVDGSGAQPFNVYTVVGLKGDALNPALDLASAKARLIARGTSPADITIPDVYDTKYLEYGLTAVKMYYNNNPTNAIGSVGFTSSISSLGDADGSQQVNILAIPGTTLNASKPAGVAQVNNNIQTAIINPSGGVQICLRSGGSNQSGLLSIGGSGRQGLVSLKIYGNKDCT